MKNLNILITEDERVQARLLQHKLTEMGHKVVAMVDSGEEALHKAERLRPDLVMMDINLAGELNGIETARLIQKQLDVPIIFVTSADDTDTIEKAVASNASGYLFKPVESKRDVSVAIDMAMTKSAYDRKLKELNKALDVKVKERTSQLEEANLKLTKALERERELNEFKSSIIINVSHQFKTPLTAIHSSAELIGKMLEMGAAPEKVFRHTKRILDSVDNLNALITEILYVEGTDKQKEAFNPQVVNLRSYLLSFMDEIKLGVGKNHTIKSEIKIDKPKVLLDKQHFHQIISNLMANAANYSEEGTTILFKIDVKEGKMKGEVRDQGIGIPEKDKAKLFDRFYRGSNVSYRQGTGIGLSIIKKAVELLGGKLDFESKLGKGTTFKFVLPIHYVS